MLSTLAFQFPGAINFLCSEWRKLSQIMIIDYFAEIFAELSILQVVAAPDAAV